MHYYQFNIGDYASHTRHLTPIEDICYRRLLDYYYLHENPIKNDPSYLARVLLLDDYKSSLESVLNEFFELTDDGWINARALKEITQYRKFIEDGKRGAAKRWGKGDYSPPKQPPIANNNHKPITNNHNNAARGTRLTQEWVAPQEYIDFCNQERPDLDANQIALQFHDYWVSKAGKDGIKADWFATWRNWIRRQEKSKSRFKNKSDVVSDDQFDKWLNPQGERNERLG